MEEVSDVAGACSAEMQKFGIHSARWVKGLVFELSAKNILSLGILCTRRYLVVFDTYDTEP